MVAEHLCMLRITVLVWSQANDEYIFTIRNPANIQGKVAIGVSYEAFVDDVQVLISIDCGLKEAHRLTCIMSHQSCMLFCSLLVAMCSKHVHRPCSAIDALRAYLQTLFCN